jgi:DNA-binding beta-propeller fold protein YncE
MSGRVGWSICFASCAIGCGGVEIEEEVRLGDAVAVRAVCKAPCVERIAGAREFGYVDGPVDQARFELPRDIAQGPNGELYVVDALANTIRVIANGEVQTFAGREGGGFKDGFVNEALFDHPSGIAVARDGTIYVADSGGQRIRKIAFGVVSTYAGTGKRGHVDGSAAQAQFNLPVDVDVDADGNVYVTELDNYAIRKISPHGVVTTIAGGPESLDIQRPRFVAAGPSGTVYFTDGERHIVRAIRTDGRLETVSGLAINGWVDGDVRSARFDDPTGIAVDAQERIFISDTGNHRIRMIANGQVSSIAGTGFFGDMDGDPRHATFVKPLGMTIGRDGEIYVTEAQFSTIRRIAIE